MKPTPAYTYNVFVWWEADPIKIAKQVANYGATKWYARLRVQAGFCLFLSAAANLLPYLNHQGAKASVLDAAIMCFLGVFVILGQRWAMIAAMMVWTFDRCLGIWMALPTLSKGKEELLVVLVQLWFWCLFMGFLYWAFRVEQARRTTSSLKEPASKPAAVMTCLSCRTPASPLARFCSKCGAEFGMNRASVAKPPASDGPSARARPVLIEAAARAARLITNPKMEWAIIAQEPSSVKQIFWRYGAVMSAIGPIGYLLNFFVLGPDPSHHSTVGQTILHAAYDFGVTCLWGNFLFSHAVFRLFRSRHATMTIDKATKLALYGSTVWYITSIFEVFPTMSKLFYEWLLIVAAVALLWCLALFRRGFIVLIDASPLKATGAAVGLLLLQIALTLVLILPGSFIG